MAPLLAEQVSKSNVFRDTSLGCTLTCIMEAWVFGSARGRKLFWPTSGLVLDKKDSEIPGVPLGYACDQD